MSACRVLPSAFDWLQPYGGVCMFLCPVYFLQLAVRSRGHRTLEPEIVCASNIGADKLSPEPWMVHVFSFAGHTDLCCSYSRENKHRQHANG